MRPTQFPLIDRLVGGGLAEKLIEWHDGDEGLSYAQMRDRLRDEHDVELSADTLRRWHLSSLEPAEASP